MLNVTAIASAASEIQAKFTWSPTPLPAPGPPSLHPILSFGELSP
jgi:hypothetical protein